MEAVCIRTKAVRDKGLLFSYLLEYYILYTKVYKVMFRSYSVFLVKLYRMSDLASDKFTKEQMQIHGPLECPMNIA
jgi:hypothetical protein